MLLLLCVHSINNCSLIINYMQCHLKYQHQISELESIRDQLKVASPR